MSFEAQQRNQEHLHAARAKHGLARGYITNEGKFMLFAVDGLLH